MDVRGSAYLLHMYKLSSLLLSCPCIITSSTAMASTMPLCHKRFYIIPSKLLHIFSQQIMILEWPSRLSGLFDHLIFYLLAFACKGRIKMLNKACVNLTAFRASVVTHPTSLKEPNTLVVMWGYHQILSLITTAHLKNTTLAV